MNSLINSKRYRIINRILNYSDVFSFVYLNEKTIKELQALQKSCLIELMVKMKFYRRHRTEEYLPQRYNAN